MRAVSFSVIDRTPPVSIEAYRRLAQKRLPRTSWAYIEGGADDLATLAQNRSAYQRWRLRQRVLSGVDRPDLSAVMAGAQVSMPICLAPTGLSGLTRWNGDICAARAAEAAGVRMVLSSGASHTLEEVAEATEQDHWFQLYANGDQDHVGWLIDRARAAGYSALFLTVDTAVAGNRESERTHGCGIPLRLTPGRCANLLSQPSWLFNFLKHRRYLPVNYDPDGTRRAKDRTLEAAAKIVAAQFRDMKSTLNWDDLAWVRERWKGKLYVKGLMDADDAVRAVTAVGADGVVVSNHGGRQLNGVPGTIDALAEIAPALKGHGEVYVDGGVRRGTDVIKALCLGARGVFVGRPYLYGLAAAGQAGAAAVLSILREELNRDLILMGCPAVAALDRSWLLQPNGAPLPSLETVS